VDRVGVGGMHEKLDYSGPHAQCRIKDSKPSFYIRVVDASKVENLVIARFKERKDKRQIETAEIVGERTGGETRNKANIYFVSFKRLGPEMAGPTLE
jgi:hypothetical protein